MVQRAGAKPVQVDASILQTQRTLGTLMNVDVIKDLNQQKMDIKEHLITPVINVKRECIKTKKQLQRIVARNPLAASRIEKEQLVHCVLEVAFLIPIRIKYSVRNMAVLIFSAPAEVELLVSTLKVVVRMECTSAMISVL